MIPAPFLGEGRNRSQIFDAAKSFGELSALPNFGLHELTGNRKGNWRMTFALKDEGALIDMDLDVSWRLKCPLRLPPKSVTG